MSSLLSPQVHEGGSPQDRVNAADALPNKESAEGGQSAQLAGENESSTQRTPTSIDEAIELLVPMRSDAFLCRIRYDDPSITSLVLRGTYVTGITINMIGDALLSNRRVTKVDLSSNNLSDADLAHFVHVGLRKNRGLKELDLSDNPDITDATFAAIREVLLADNDTLTTVHATGTSVTPQALRDFNRLSALNSFPVELKRQLYAAGENDDGLFAIRLTYDPSDPKVYNAQSTRALAEVLGATRKNQPDEGSFHTPVGSTRRNVLGPVDGKDDDPDDLIPPINNTVRAVYLTGCCRGEVCVRELLPIFSTNPHITRVHLDHNYLGDESVEMICDAISKAGDACGLEELVLDNNEITNGGAKALIRMLQRNTSIKRVSLLHNPRFTSPSLQEQLRIEMALNCEPASMRPAIDKIRQGLPENLGRDAEKQLYLRQQIGEMLNPEGILTLSGTPDDVDGKGPSRGYYTSLGATTIALALRTNISIHTINFRNNHIGPEGAKALADLLEYNPTIVRLDLSENPITDEGARHLLNVFATNDALVTLHLTDSEVSQRLVDDITAACHLNSQPEPIKAILREKDYTFKGSGDPSTATTPDDGVVRLDLSKRPVQVRGKWKGLHAESAQYVATILRKQPHITHLDLSDNDSFGDGGVQGLRDWLVHPKCALKRLDLSNTGITDASLSLLSQCSRANYSLLNIVVAGNPGLSTRLRQELDEAISLNRFPTQVKDMVPSLHANVNGITSINFSREPDQFYQKNRLPIPSPLGDDTAKLLFSALVRNTKVTTVVLRNQGMGNRAMGYLLECLSVNETITTLDLAHNQIGSEGATELASLLDRNTTLRSVDLSHNGISEEGAVALLYTMNTANRTIHYLNLCGCASVLPTTRKKVECLAAFNTQAVPFRRHILERISSLSNLRCNGHPDSAHFVGCIVQDDAVQALAMALNAQPHKVQSIDFTNNLISDAGCRVLLRDILPMHTCITHVNLSNNPITDEVGAEIVAYLQENRHMLEFRVGNAPAVEATNTKKLNMKVMYEDAIASGGGPIRNGLVEAPPTYTAAACKCCMSPLMVKRITTTSALNRTPVPFQRAYLQLEGKLVQWHNLKEQLLDKVRRDEEDHSPAHVRHRLREQQRRTSQHRLLAGNESGSSPAEEVGSSLSAIPGSASGAVTATTPSRKSELLTTINKVVPSAVNFARTDMTGAELQLLCDLLDHFDVFGSNTLKGLQLSDNPALDDDAIRKLVLEYLLPHCTESLQALHLDRTGLADRTYLTNSNAGTSQSVVEVLTKLANSSSSLVSLSYTGTPLTRSIKMFDKGLQGENDVDENGGGDSWSQSLVAAVEDTKNYNPNAVAYIRQLQAAITTALERNRSRLVGNATEEFFAEKTRLSHPYQTEGGGLLRLGGGGSNKSALQGVNADPNAPLLSTTPAEMRDEADSILADALRAAPARVPYARGKYSSTTS